MSTILVTGATGVIGSWVTRKLLEEGRRVIGYDNRADFALLKDVSDRIECVIGDILDLPNIIHTLQRNHVERVIHMAALMPAPMEVNPLVGFRVNAEGTVNILEAARLTGLKRVVLTSSKAVYDVTRGEYGHPTYKPMDEDYPKIPHLVYGTTKLFAENMALDYNRIYGLDPVILRFSSPYGIGRQARHGAYAITSKIIESAMLGQPLNIPQGAEQKDDFLYHRDVAHGIVLACFAENLEHRIFNIGRGKGETLADFIEVVRKLFGEVPITIGPGTNPQGAKDLYYSVFNIERAKRELGFRPQYDLEAGIRDYVDTMRRFDIKPVVLS